MPGLSDCAPSCCATPSPVNIVGSPGQTGAPGPNTITAATTTDQTGLITGNGANISATALPLSIANGGTGAATRAAALTALLGAAPPAVVNYSAITAAGAVNNLAVATGVGMSQLICRHDWTVGGTSAVEPITNYTIGYKFRVVSWAWITSVLMTGAGGSRVANLAIGGVPVGTVASTVTVAIASAAVGSVIASTAVSGANTGSATATLSVQIASGGTALTGGSGIFVILLQNMDTADAIASLSQRVDALITSLT